VEGIESSGRKTRVPELPDSVQVPSPAIGPTRFETMGCHWCGNGEESYGGYILGPGRGVGEEGGLHCA